MKTRKTEGQTSDDATKNGICGIQPEWQRRRLVEAAAVCRECSVCFLEAIQHMMAGGDVRCRLIENLTGRSC